MQKSNIFTFLKLASFNICQADLHETKDMLFSLGYCLRGHNYMFFTYEKTHKSLKRKLQLCNQWQV
ncbi:hypothetical protein T4D_15232 [Trichinella pseudospiralis]|uniref:Uncharacterized protein n=1 Tax=Trichinella pseudospiralis TaxID=6337 RepID=A0A0V1FYL1_TRIPS|nr:hypothetical protein T4D_15232 [Trichinella pseudospiralis]